MLENSTSSPSVCMWMSELVCIAQMAVMYSLRWFWNGIPLAFCSNYFISSTSFHCASTLRSPTHKQQFHLPFCVARYAQRALAYSGNVEYNMNCRKIRSKLAFKELSEIASFQNFCFVFTWLFELLQLSPSNPLSFRAAPHAPLCCSVLAVRIRHSLLPFIACPISFAN